MLHKSYWHFNFVFLLQNKIKVVALKITNNINVLIKVSGLGFFWGGGVWFWVFCFFFNFFIFSIPFLPSPSSYLESARDYPCVFRSLMVPLKGNTIVFQMFGLLRLYAFYNTKCHCCSCHKVIYCFI